MARSIVVSRKHTRKMAIAASVIAYHLREISGVLVGLSEELGTTTNTPNLLGTNTTDRLMRMHEILAADAEYLDRMKVFLGHLLHAAPQYSPKAAVAKAIGEGTSASW